MAAAEQGSPIGASSNSLMDDDFSEMMNDLRSELAEVEKQEAQVESEIKSLLASMHSPEPPAAFTVSHGKQIMQQLDSVDRCINPRLDKLSGRVVGLSEHIYSCQELADKMSCAVRKLDERQMRVHRVLAMVEDVLNLKTCALGVERALQEGDLPDAVSYVKQFHGIEGPAAKASEHYDAMVTAEQTLKDTVMRRVESAVAASNLEDVFKYCPLLGPLGLAAEGAKIYERFAQRLLHESLAQFSEVPEKGGKDPRAGSAVVLLPRIFNTVAAFLQHHLPLVAHGFKQVAADQSLLRLVHREAEQVAIPLLRRFISARRLADKCRVASMGPPPLPSSSTSTAAGGSSGAASPTGLSNSSSSQQGGLNLGELDELLDELALVIQQTESYDRYVRYLAAEALVNASATDLEISVTKSPIIPQVSDLNSAVAEVSGPYSVLEDHFMTCSVRRAMAIDEPPQPLSTWAEGRTSSCVDDAFYVIRRCCRRALVTGHAGTASAIVNYVNSILSDELLRFLLSRITTISSLPTLGPGSAPPGSSASTASGAAIRHQWTKVREGLEAAVETNANLTAVAGSITGALGNIATGSSEHEALQSLNRLIHINNLAACALYTTKLHAELAAEVPTIYQDEPPTQQLVAVLQDLCGTCRHFSGAVDEALEHVVALLKPRLRAFLQEAIGDKSKVSFELDESAFAQYQVLDPYAHRVVEFLSALLQPVAARIAEVHYDQVQQSVADYLCKRLETLLIRKRFTQLGGLQLDKDLRCIMGFFPTRRGSRLLRDRFARLTQIAMILNLDKASDLSESLRDGFHWKLTPDEILTVLKRRVDFTEEEIAAVSLHVRQEGSDDA